MSQPGGPDRAARHVAARVAVALAAGTAMLTVSATPLVTLLNDAIEVRWRFGYALAAFSAAVGWLVVALPHGARPLRLLAGMLALAAASTGTDRALFRARVDDAGLSSRGLFGTTSLAWRDVTRVESGSARLIVSGRDERQVRVPVDGWREDQRAALERSIARRVREAAAAAATR